MTSGYNATYATGDATAAGTDIVVGFLVQIASLIGIIALLFVLGYLIHLVRRIGIRTR